MFIDMAGDVFISQFFLPCFTLFFPLNYGYFHTLPLVYIVHTMNWYELVIQVYALISNTEEAEVEWFYEDLQDLLELTPKKDVLFIIGD